MKNFCSFSEAIREGAKLKPQTRVHLMDENGTCAVGAGLHAMYLDELSSSSELTHVRGWPIFELDVYNAYPYMKKPVEKCPHVYERKWWQIWHTVSICVWGARGHSLLDTIAHLNDNHRWARERIADWLESEEEKLGFITLVESEPAVDNAQLAATVSAHSQQDKS